MKFPRIMPNWMYDPTTVEFDNATPSAPAVKRPELAIVGSTIVMLNASTERRPRSHTQARRIKVRMALKRVMKREVL